MATEAAARYSPRGLKEKFLGLETHHGLINLARMRFPAS
jgi:hypothetical protein